MKFNPRLLQNPNTTKLFKLHSLHSPALVPADQVARFNLLPCPVKPQVLFGSSSITSPQNTSSSRGASWPGFLLQWGEECPVFSARLLGPCCCRFHTQLSPRSFLCLGVWSGSPVRSVQLPSRPGGHSASSPFSPVPTAHSQRWGMDIGVWWCLCCCSCSFSPVFSVLHFPTCRSPSWDSFLLLYWAVTSPLPKACCWFPVQLAGAFQLQLLVFQNVSKTVWFLYILHWNMNLFIHIYMYILTYKMELELTWIPYPSFPCKNTHTNIGINFSGWTPLLCCLCAVTMFRLHKSLKECVF